MNETARSLTTHPIHHGLGATVEVEPLFTRDMAWYGGYPECGDGHFHYCGC
ncbi:MAG: hypothetical protein ACI88C_001309 [Acidimicrobiales bacterium]|jgi:hypothetical protein